MNFIDILNEKIKIKSPKEIKDPYFYRYKLKEIVEEALEKVFSKKFLNKIETDVKKIVIRLKNSKGIYKGRYSRYLGRILLDPYQVFYDSGKREEVFNIIAHELFHLVTFKRRFFFTKWRFAEVKEFIHKFMEFLEDSIGEKKLKRLFPNPETINNYSIQGVEIISYIISGDINWNILKPEDREKSILLIKKSKLFNTRSIFWKNIFKDIRAGIKSKHKLK